MGLNANKLWQLTRRLRAPCQANPPPRHWVNVLCCFCEGDSGRHNNFTLGLNTKDMTASCLRCGTNDVDLWEALAQVAKIDKGEAYRLYREADSDPLLELVAAQEPAQTRERGKPLTLEQWDDAFPSPSSERSDEAIGWIRQYLVSTRLWPDQEDWARWRVGVGVTPRQKKLPFIHPPNCRCSPCWSRFKGMFHARVMFPGILNNEVVHFTARSLDATLLPPKNLDFPVMAGGDKWNSLFGTHLLEPGQDMVYLVEGPMDAITVGPPCLAYWGAQVYDPQIALLRSLGIRTVVHIPDRDMLEGDPQKRKLMIKNITNLSAAFDYYLALLPKVPSRFDSTKAAKDPDEAGRRISYAAIETAEKPSFAWMTSFTLR